MKDREERSRRKRSGWNADPAMDYPVGPDDTGNAVMHGIGILVNAWRWLVAKVGKRPR